MFSFFYLCETSSKKKKILKDIGKLIEVTRSSDEERLLERKKNEVFFFFFQFLLGHELEIRWK